MTELPDDVYTKITSLTEEGNTHFDSGRLAEALERFEKAMDLVPEPITDWEASTWILTAIADCHFLLGRFQEAHHTLSMGIHCPGALGIPFIHLRLGQVQYELGNMERAKDELARAYMGGGEELFELDDPKYLSYIKTFMKT